MKVAYVVPRYGERVVGGAEQACRMLAERLASSTDWTVEVLTTAAVDGTTWRNELPPGNRCEGGVTVRRFPTEPRHPDFGALSLRLLAAPEGASPADQQLWVDMQGPRSTDLLDAIASSDADVMVFTPYLFHPTVQGIGRAGGRTVLHPAAHDEAPVRLPVFAGAFTAADALCFYSDAEQRLADRLFPVAHHRQQVLGLGVEGGHGDEESFRRDHGLGEDPYLLCLGRVDGAKGATQLARLFAAYKAENPGRLRLVLTGQVVTRPPEHPDTVVTGMVDDDRKWGALRGATALVSPSTRESFSLALMEAWVAGIPVIVNGACAATSEHVSRSRGGAIFRSYATFEAAVEVLLRDPQGRRALAQRGAAYVDRNYRWPDLMERYAHFLERVASAPPRQ